MRDVNLNNLTDVATASFNGLTDERQRYLIQELVKAVHNYARTTQLTHNEWRAALAFMHRVGEITSDERSEFSLLSDVLGLSSMVDLMASAPKATPGSVLGPFHVTGSPWLSNPADLVGQNTGEQVILRGQVIGADNQQPLSEATLDFWQNASNGLYWQVDPEQPRDNLRCQMKVDAQGRFEIHTIRPVPYQIPSDGPVWNDLVQPAGRHNWRAAHFHLIVSAPGHRSLVTELFDDQDPYLDSDAVFGVRQALIGQFVPTTDTRAGDGRKVMEVVIRLAAMPA